MEFFIKALLLGILQGIAEFLPISSSGHLAVAEHFMGVTEPGVFFEVMLHIGTLASVLVYFRKDVLSLLASFFWWIKELAGKEVAPADPTIYARDKKLIVGIVVATIPTGLMGILAKDYFESLFSRIDMIGFALMITGVILFAAETISTRRKENAVDEVKPTTAFLIGIAQGIAITPGISRSGSTVSAGLALGLKPEEAARFSFLLSIPAILGALVLSVGDVAMVEKGEIPGYVAGTIASGIVGYFAIGVLMSVVKKGRLRWFSLYCVLMGAAVAAAGLAGY